MLEVGIKEPRTVRTRRLRRTLRGRERERGGEDHYAVKRQNERDLSIGRFGCCGAISYGRLTDDDKSARITPGIKYPDNPGERMRRAQGKESVGVEFEAEFAHFPPPPPSFPESGSKRF